MTKHYSAGAMCLGAGLVLSGCGGSAMVRYNDGKDASAGEYTFVVPRTVIRIEAEAPKASGDGKAAAAPKNLTFTAVPLATDDDGKDLPRFSIKDDSSGGFTWVPTSVTSVTYADQLIIQSIGTAITDNRKSVIDSVFGLVGTVAAFGGLMGKSDKCPEATLADFKPFVLAKFALTGDKQYQRLDTNPCWGYSLVAAPEVGGSPGATFAVKDGLPLDTKVAWFPYPACSNYRVTVVKCKTQEGVCDPDGKDAYQSVVARSDGRQYRRVAFPPKGKISMHSNFCVADVTSDSAPLASDWEIANQLLSNTKALLKPADAGKK